MSNTPDQTPTASRAERGMRAAFTGMWVNAAMVVVKLVAGLLGHSYALVADAVESSTDIFSSIIVWGGLRMTTRPADDDYPYGYGKAETLAAAVVSLMLLGAAIGIAVAAVREIATPHHAPAPFTLVVIAVVVVVKETLSRRVLQVGLDTGSAAVKADAWHHRSDALTSAAAFIGISVALWGGPGWESADDWAALAAAALIAFNGFLLLRPAVRDLMDRMPEGPVADLVARAARDVDGVLGVEKLRIRRHGTEYFVDIHVEADRMLPLWEAHVLSGKVKGAIRAAMPNVGGVLVHMEPHEPPVNPPEE
ncbi:MAG: cation diffusion facilitator family transporter [Isosphaeraceae bacterium]|nr:cation diffusion facilitator family transporter [Isosphaeraceae bacterium]